MHILLGLVGSIVTILVILHRLADLGIGLGGLNPFLWRRRRSWRQKFEANPIFALEDPREIAAVLLTGVAKIDGDLSAGEKRALLDEFEHTFSMNPKMASELLASTVYLLGNLEVLHGQPDELFERYRERLAPEQITSLLEITERIAALNGGPTPNQSALVTAVRRALAPVAEPQGTWG
jgi:hypothetical protein